MAFGKAFADIVFRFRVIVHLDDLCLFGLNRLLDSKGNHFARLAAFLHHPFTDDSRPALSAFADVGIAGHRFSARSLLMRDNADYSDTANIAHLQVTNRDGRIGRQHQRKNRDHVHRHLLAARV